MTPFNVHTYVIDVDGTLAHEPMIPGNYATCQPNTKMINKVNKLYEKGHTIILFTSRGMRSYKEDIIDIHIHVKPVLIDWLVTFDVKYTKLVMGKPWGPNVHYIDDKNMTFEEFLRQ